ncbi:hypothetical protein DLAC_02160 [Tieghemostelium lacteum]|uniref:Uncharacterized protein n=1 Tax=Tieghemostelium lacteum TaxID=361077 RepID=A0A152A4A9_TIELA|nr:hypothetical protein DLAC_02160 [Tieghemostelium lacteum]|eukprot:KYR01066.1 hypothetical protein DLAC_02160 [Tieghemostelium lacteum]
MCFPLCKKDLVYGDRSDIILNYDEKMCIYCQVTNNDDKKCSCTADEDIIKKLGFIEFNMLANSFYEWCSKLDIDIKPTQTSNKNYLLPLLSINNRLQSDYRYNKFTQWIHSKSPRQRLISYLFVMKSRLVQSELLEEVFYSMLQDGVNFRILKRVPTVLKVVSGDLIVKVLNQLARDKKQDQSTELQGIVLEWIFSFINISTNGEALSLSMETLQGLLQNYPSSIYLNRKSQSNFQIDISKPLLNELEYYLDAILYVFINNNQTIISHLTSKYRTKLSKILSEYLIYHLDSDTQESVDSCIGILLHKDQLNLTDSVLNDKIDRFIYQLVYNSNELDPVIQDNIKKQLVFQISNVDLYFEIGLYDWFEGENLSHYLFWKLQTVSEYRRSKFKESLKNFRKSGCYSLHLLIFKFFDNDTVQEYLYEFATSRISQFRLLSNYTLPLSLEILLHFTKTLDEMDMEYQPRIYNFIGIYLLELFEKISDPKLQKNIKDHVIEMIYQNAQQIKSILETVDFQENIYAPKKYVVDCLFKCRDISEALLKGCPDTYEIICQLISPHIIPSNYSEKYTSESRSNMILVLHKHVNLEQLLLTEGGGDFKLNYDLIVEVITDFYKYGDSGLELFIHTYRDRAILDRLFQFYDKQPDNIPIQIYKYCEFVIFLNLKFATQWSFLSATLVANILKILKVYYHDMTNLYRDNIHLRDSNEIRSLTLLLKRFGPLCLKSHLFREFYFSLTPLVLDHLEDSKFAYQFQLERSKVLMMEDNIIHPVYTLPTLPIIVWTKILHFLFYDTTIDAYEKIHLATISRLWFNMCSNIVTNYYFEDTLSNYITVLDFKGLNIHSPYCLFRNYPKLMNYRNFRYVPADDIDNLLYTHTESLEIYMDEKFVNGISLCRDTNIEGIEMTIQSEYIPTVNIISLFEHSPKLKKLVIYIFSERWTQLNHFNQLMESIMAIGLKYLQQISVYIAHELKPSTGFDLTNITTKYKKLPKFTLISIPNYVKFKGFGSVSVKILDELDITYMTEFYQEPFSQAKDSIGFSIKFHNQIIPLIEFIETNHSTNNMTICINHFDTTPITIELVQSIFDRLNETTNIQSFSIYIHMYTLTPYYSILPQEEWQKINLKKFKFTNNIFTKFYQTLK